MLCNNLNITYVILGSAIAQAVSRRPLNVEVWFQSKARLCGICGAQRQWNRLFSEYIAFPMLLPVQ
jgi:hypothetical protein